VSQNEIKQLTTNNSSAAQVLTKNRSNCATTTWVVCMPSSIRDDNSPAMRT